MTAPSGIGSFTDMYNPDNRCLVPIRTPSAVRNTHIVSSILCYTDGSASTYENPPYNDDRSSVRVELVATYSVHVKLVVCEERVTLTVEPREHV